VWVLWRPHGCSWISWCSSMFMGIYGDLQISWLSVDIHQYLCISIDIYACPCVCMHIHGYPWTSMDIHGHPRTSMDIRTSTGVWASFEPC
jgi:hypothetical protein